MIVVQLSHARGQAWIKWIDDTQNILNPDISIPCRKVMRWLPGYLYPLQKWGFIVKVHAGTQNSIYMSSTRFILSPWWDSYAYSLLGVSRGVNWCLYWFSGCQFFGPEHWHTYPQSLFVSIFSCTWPILLEVVDNLRDHHHHGQATRTLSPVE